MSDLEVLILVLVLLYLSECCLWVRRGCVVFRSLGTSSFAVAYASRLLGNEHWGMVFLNPLPPLGTAFVSRYWPVSLTSVAIYSYIAHSTDPAGEPAQLAQYIPFHQIRGLWHRGGDVLVNGTAFLRLGDETLASFYAETLASIWQLPEDQREAAIDTALATSMDERTVEEKMIAWREQSKVLRAWCHVVFVMLFVVLPASMWFWQIRANWPLYGVALLASVAGTAIHFHSLHRQLFPTAVQERWKALATMILMPTSAIRACDMLSKHVLAAQDPLAIASVLCPRDRFRDFARRILLDLNHPALLVCPSDHPECLIAEHKSRIRLRHLVESLLSRRGYSPEEIMAPYAPTDPTHVSFCPRCDMQYVTPAGVCADCGGIPLQSFPPTSAPMRLAAEVAGK